MLRWWWGENMDQVSKNFFILLLVNIALGCTNEPFVVADDEPRAILIDGSGTYSREISTTVERSGRSTASIRQQSFHAHTNLARSSRARHEVPS